ncbi:MAG: DMT family transporter, partial [Vicinamibacteria bacterium]
PLLLAVACISFGSIFVRLAQAPALTVSFYRMFLASLLLAPFALPTALPAWRALSFSHVLLLLGSGTALALHFATWIASLSLTSVAASVLLVDMTPVFTLLLAWVALREPPTLRLVSAVGLAIAGAAWIATGDSASGPAPLRGDLLALAGAVSLAVHHVIGRGLRLALPLGAYVLGVWAVAAIVLASFAFASDVPLGGYPPRTLVAFLALALVPTLMGHGLINRSLRTVPAAVVGLFLLGEPIGASILAYALFGEVPSSSTVTGGILVMGALGLVASGGTR